MSGRSPLFRLLRRSLFLSFVLASSGPVFAGPSLRHDYPCKGCLFLPPPEHTTKSPLLVVLHGDAPGGKTPLLERDSAPFVTAAAERGIAVFAPMCPKDEGCLVGSYWQWSRGDPPAWIEKQIDIIRETESIDAARTWMAGWSGGASFLGYHYARLAGRYAAVIFAGGGMAPVSSACSPCAPPAYFLVGDKNPLHHLAKDLRSSILSCTHDVTWDLLPGSDHGGEWRAFNRPGKVGELLDWLAKHPQHCLVNTEKPAVAPSASAVPVPVVSVAKPIPSAPVAPTPSRGCATTALDSQSGAAVFIVGLVLAWTRRRWTFRAS